MVAVAYNRETYEPVIPFGARIRLEGLGEYTVSDTCGACESTWLDVYEPSRARAIELGVKVITGTVKRP